MSVTDQDLSKVLAGISTESTYPELLRTARSLKRLYAHAERCGDSLQSTSVRMALVGNSTLGFLVAPLEVHLAVRGIRAELIVGGYGSYEQELISADSPIYTANPRVIVVITDHHAVAYQPKPGETPAEVDRLANLQVQEWTSLWQNVSQHCQAAIVQTTIAIPCERIAGNLEAKAAWGQANYYRQLNRLLAERAPGNVSLCDADYLSGLLGKQYWFDEPAWFHSKLGIGFPAIAMLAHNLAAVTAAVLGKARKCLVLDLDDTLWGGVVGDAGVQGIRLGQGDSVGEAFVAFQRYCLQLKQRGVVLAVCSKNDPEIARSPFREHPETVLRLEDFGAFIANWDDKAKNLREIASQLNLGLDSLVFVDDNPAERDLIRQVLPDVAVPHIPADPALYRRALDKHLYFEPAVLSHEDIDRAGYYAAEQRRREEASVSTNIADFLRSLQQECWTGSFDELNLERVLQLINKTNQWNLTTHRLTEPDVRCRMMDPAYYTLWARHRDRFGDNGLICVLIARESERVLYVEDWIMSCRVIGRGIEDFVFNELLSEACRRGIAEIHGTYRPTAKNGLVADLYASLGFDRFEIQPDGTCDWRLKVKADLSPRSHSIGRSKSASLSLSQQAGPVLSSEDAR